MEKLSIITSVKYQFYDWALAFDFKRLEETQEMWTLKILIWLRRSSLWISFMEHPSAWEKSKLLGVVSREDSIPSDNIFFNNRRILSSNFFKCSTWSDEVHKNDTSEWNSKHGRGLHRGEKFQNDQYPQNLESKFGVGFHLRGEEGFIKMPRPALFKW